MNKQQLIDTIAETSGEKKAVVDRILEALTTTVTEAIKDGEDVTLLGLGKFKPLARSSRVARNPKTGAPVTVAARSGIKFAPSSILKDALN